MWSTKGQSQPEAQIVEITSALQNIHVKEDYTPFFSLKTCFFAHRGIVISKIENLHPSLYKIPKGIKLLLINKYKCCLKTN